MPPSSRTPHIAILLQGLAERAEAFVSDHPWLRSDDLFVLSYDRPLRNDSKGHKIYNPECSWAAGRNLLFEAARSTGQFHGFVFMDDDVVFNKGNLREFIDLCQANSDWFIAPVTEKAVTARGVLDCDYQRPLLLDDQMYYVPAALIQKSGVYPLVTDYDQVSWWVSCEISQRILLQRHWGDCLQVNRVRIANVLHRAGTEGSKYRTSSFATLFKTVESHVRQAGMASPLYRSFAHAPAGSLARSYWRVLRALRRLRAPIPSHRLRSQA